MDPSKVGSWYCIHNTSFTSLLKYGPNKIEHQITLGHNGLPVINILSYWERS